MNDEVSPEGLVKISFECREDERVGSVKTETLWAEPVEGDLYRLRNVPIYVYGFSEYDVVSATRRDDRLTVTRAASRGGQFNIPSVPTTRYVRRQFLKGLDTVSAARMHLPASNFPLRRD